MGLVNINLTLQFFFPNFFIIYKILTSPFLVGLVTHVGVHFIDAMFTNAIPPLV